MNRTPSIILGIIVLAALGVGIFFYATRPAPAPTETPEPVAATETNGATYRIAQSDSRVEFKIGETLNGKPFTAVGTTSNITGTITVDGNAISIGTISVNARTFKTDSEKRDGAIARLILKSEDPANEWITFTPTSVEGLPASIPNDTEFTATVMGNLTIAGKTNPAIMNLTMNISDTAISGTATTTVKRSDYGLVIPNIPFVANVDESFLVTATIVANNI